MWKGAKRASIAIASTCQLLHTPRQIETLKPLTCFHVVHRWVVSHTIRMVKFSPYGGSATVQKAETAHLPPCAAVLSLYALAIE